MIQSPHSGAGPAGPAPAASASADGIDERIAATWAALRANPDLDHGSVMRSIDRLLDERAGQTTRPSASALPGARQCGSGTEALSRPVQLAVITSILEMLL
jgi:hypothetical protein